MSPEQEAKCCEIFKKEPANWTQGDYAVLIPLIKNGERENLKMLRLKTQLA